MNEEELNQAVQAAFDVNPGVEQFHVIANGNCFERENDARHAVRHLRENERWVRLVQRAHPLTPGPSPKDGEVDETTPDEGGETAPKTAGDASNDAELGGGAGNTTDKSFLLGSSKLPAIIELPGGPYALGTVVAKSQKESGFTVEQWNELPDGSREELIAATVEKMKAPAPTMAATYGNKVKKGK